MQGSQPPPSRIVPLLGLASADHDGVGGGAARLQHELPRVDAVGKRDDVAGRDTRERRRQRGGVGDRPHVRRRRITRHGARGCGHDPRLVDGPVGVGRVQLDLVRRRWTEVEDAARELLRNRAAVDGLGADAQEGQGVSPRRGADDAIADGDTRVMVGVAADVQLNAERDQGRTIDVDGIEMKPDVGAGVNAVVRGVATGDRIGAERVLRGGVETWRADALPDESGGRSVELRERLRFATLLVERRVGEREIGPRRLGVALDDVRLELREERAPADRRI